MKKRFSAPLIGLVLLSSACANLLEPAAAVVEGKKITVDEVSSGLERFTRTAEFERLSTQGDAQAIQRQFEQGFLSQLIRRSVLEPRAETFDVEVTDDELNARLEQIQDDFPSVSAFEEALKEQGLDREQLEQLVRDSLLEEELRAGVTAEAAPTDAELRDYYESHEDEFSQTRAQHILVDNKNLAEQIGTQARTAPKKKAQQTFAKLAKDFSTDKANARKGGDLGFFSSGELVPPFEQAAAALDIGEVSDPVKTDFGWHVIRVTDRRVSPFEEVSDQIAERLSVETEDRVWSEWLAAAYKDADVKVNPRYGELDLESGQVVDATAEDIPGAESQPQPTVTPSLGG
ncbi:MAG TPA: peptidylprolyl isomerase [Actinomycetota bacterium]|nr:peptidylprolyl isomerase [Actinomycetota bacterium]